MAGRLDAEEVREKKARLAEVVRVRWQCKKRPGSRQQ